MYRNLFKMYRNNRANRDSRSTMIDTVSFGRPLLRFDTHGSPLMDKNCTKREVTSPRDDKPIATRLRTPNATLRDTTRRTAPWETKMAWFRATATATACALNLT